MPVKLSTKHVPDRIVAKLKRRAAANHRSLQGELAAILEQAVATPGTAGETKKPWMKSGGNSGESARGRPTKAFR